MERGNGGVGRIGKRKHTQWHFYRDPQKSLQHSVERKVSTPLKVSQSTEGRWLWIRKAGGDTQRYPPSGNQDGHRAPVSPNRIPISAGTPGRSCTPGAVVLRANFGHGRLETTGSFSCWATGVLTIKSHVALSVESNGKRGTCLEAEGDPWTSNCSDETVRTRRRSV